MSTRENIRLIARAPFQIGLKSLLHQDFQNLNSMVTWCINGRGLLAQIIFQRSFYKIISHYYKIGYNINVQQLNACFVDNPSTVVNFAFLFNCTPVGRTSDSLTVPT